MIHSPRSVRRQFLPWLAGAAVLLTPARASAEAGNKPAAAAPPPRPNILFAISDDQSYPHASAYGCKGIATPAFDRVAAAGVLFMNAIAASPGCSPCRAAILTGRHTWQIEHAGTHASYFPRCYPVFPDLLEEAGYHIGATGKLWGPGDWKHTGWPRNPAGPAIQSRKLKPPYKGIRNTDYAGNFALFLEQRPAGKPFFFWYGASEPHRGFEKGSWRRAGKSLEEVEVPPFLPDTPEVRGDILDYYVEIEHFDHHLGRMLDRLAEAGELDNTLVVVTSDNGMAFPRAKANGYEYGIHLPLAAAWPALVPGGRRVDDLIQFVDFAPTFLQAAGLGAEPGHAGRGLLPLLRSGRAGTVEPGRDAAYAARERHSSSRWRNLGYPVRSLRTRDHLLVWNPEPGRWPAGAPQKFDRPGELGPPHGAYHDIDACPTLSLLVERRDDPAVKPFFHLAVDRRPAYELFDLRTDPGNLRNLATDPAHAATFARLRDRLQAFLQETDDPRASGRGDVFETYRRVSRIRDFPPP